MILLSFVLLPLFSKTVKTPGNCQFRNLAPQGGFYYDGVISIFQDNSGFVWVLMANDLFRFDGYQYKRYYARIDGLDVSKKWYFTSLVGDSSGNIYLSSFNGLFVYDALADRFKKVLDQSVSFVSIDQNDQVWLHSKVFGQYRVADGLVHPITYNGEPLMSVSRVRPVADGLLIGTIQGEVFFHDLRTNETKLLFALESRGYVVGLECVGGCFWVLTLNHGLVRVDQGGAVEIFDFGRRTDGSSSPGKDLLLDRENKLWIATQDGLVVFDPSSGVYSVYRHSKENDFSLPDNSVWVLREDRARNIWIGTFSGGLAYYDFNDNFGFSSYYSQVDKLNCNVVSGFAEDDDALWIATEGGGINRWDKRTGIFSYFLHKDSKNSLSANNVKSILKDVDGRLWCATYRGGLSCLSADGKQFFNITYSKDKPDGILSNNLRKLVAGGDSGLWIIYQMDRLALSFYDFKNNRFQHFRLDDKSNDRYVFDMVRGQGDDLWVATHKSLYLFDVRTHTSKRFDPSGSKALNAQSIWVDGKNRIWLGTIGSGLVCFTPSTNHFDYFGEILKMDVSTIFSICAGDSSTLWLGTDNGLVCFDIDQSQFVQYDKQDGVQGRVFSPLASEQGRDGVLYFGGTNGFTVVRPGKINANQSLPRAMITDFLVDNEPIIKEHWLNGSGGLGIEVNHNQANFGFDFTSDNYLIPQKSRFKYRLKGYDDRWMEVGANQRRANFFKVPPGNYVFEVLACNSSGVWGVVPEVFHVRRLPAPWATWWAIVGYVLVILFGVYFTVLNYRHRKQLQLKLLLEDIDKQNKEELHQSQLRFFTYVSHDFRTPLSLILATVNRMKQEGWNGQFLKLLQSNAHRLLALVNDLLDFRTVESNSMKLNLSAIEVNTVMAAVASDFALLAVEKKVEIKVVLDSNLNQHLLVDSHVLERVVVNLLHNAFKHCEEGSSVCLQTSIGLDGFHSSYSNHVAAGGIQEGQAYFQIIIADTGDGISPNDIEHVFDSYFKASTGHHGYSSGSGIGLALVKSLVLLHKGAIVMSSCQGKGTDVVISLPLEPTEAIKNPLSASYEDDQQVGTLLSVDPCSDKQPFLSVLSADGFLLREKRQLLLVEDHGDLRLLLKDYLSRVFHVVEASNGQEALRVLDCSEIDLIVSDVMMPVMNGLQLCSAVKANVDTSHIPFVLLTAKAGVQNRIEGTGCGADLYFEKPVDMQLLLLSLENIFKRQYFLKEHYARNYYVDASEIVTNQQDNKFLKQLCASIDARMDDASLDVGAVADELCMSRSKLYSKVKSLTGKSAVEFILSYRLRHAARLLVDGNLTVREAMERIGVESASYFSRSFKKEFDMTPTAFVEKHKNHSSNGKG